jgi:putative phosphoribosyl transferase
LKIMFRDREDAAAQLAQGLVDYKGLNAVVLAIPRGGVPIGYIIAKALHLPMEPALSKKIGHPMNREYAIGSVSLFGSYINPDASVSREYIELETMRIRNLLREKYKQFMGDREPLDLKNLKVIITDDGIATGSTVLATVKAVKMQEPEEIIVAAPVASQSAVDRIMQEGVKVVCVSVPYGFQGVGQFYEDFTQVNDETVIDLLRKAGSSSSG